MSAIFASQACNATIPHVRATPFLPLAGRICLAAIFLVAGTMKFLSWDATAATMEQHHLPAVQILLPLAATAEIAGGLALFLGCLTRLACGGLILFLIPATVIFHNFWTQSGMEAQNNMHHFLKNLAIIGGLLFVLAFGPGGLSLDKWRGERAIPPR